LSSRWLGTVPYREAETLQRALHERATDDYLLLLEHPHVYTLGSSAHPEHVLRAPESVGAELVHADRGGDVTYHGPGQLVGYPIVTLAEWRAGQRDVVAYVRKLEDVLIAVLADFGIAAERMRKYTGVWVGNEKVAAIGVRVARGRTRHGFALNVAPDLSMFGHIVPCGITDKGVTSMAKLLGETPSMREVVERATVRFGEVFGYEVERHAVAWERPVPNLGNVTLSKKRPDWMRVRARMDDEFIALKRLVRDLDLHTVCEEAGCPNIYECWGDRTATFMILGDRCTRACGFCLIDTRKPLAVDPGEPQRVADAIATLDLAHAVITCVARDDLPDGGASVFAATVDAVRATNPGTGIELLIADCKGDPSALQTIFDARPDVLNHNLETVARLQRLARPSAGYARSLGVLARAKDAGLVTKSGLILGMGETAHEVLATIGDLRNVGVDLLTIGQYLQPSGSHLPVAKWWHPDEFAAFGEYAESLGFSHVESGPLVRSSYHARAGAATMESGWEADRRTLAVGLRP
jgi:lipoic acid synthetase